MVEQVPTVKGGAMTPESIPGLSIPEEELRPAALLPYHEGPAYEHHEVLLTDLPEAA
jgi:hypothetical protein